MTRTVLASGTQTADGNEDILKDDTSNQGYVVDGYVDCNAMVATEVIELRVYAKLLSGGTLHEVYYRKVLYNDLLEANNGSPIIYIPAITEPYELKVTLKQTVYSSSYKSFPWTLYYG